MKADGQTPGAFRNFIDSSSGLRLWRYVGAAVLAAFFLAVIAILLGPLTVYVGGGAVRGISDAKQRADALNAVRQSLLAAAAGSTVAVGLIFTARTYLLSKRGQHTDRYLKSMGLLASERKAERVGAVFALEQLMRDSRHDQDVVEQVLTSFLRERSPAVGAIDGQALGARNESSTPEADILAAAVVLGRQSRRSGSSRLDMSELDLRNARLAGSNFRNANLQKTLLSGADLSRSDLRGADLTDSDLSSCSLASANLRGTNLRRARMLQVEASDSIMAEAVLEDADLSNATLTRSDLRYANFSKANLRGANLTMARREGTNLDAAYFVSL
jgi:uncharacterized protein YjbI with pentapeptide repeats